VSEPSRCIMASAWQQPEVLAQMDTSKGKHVFFSYQIFFCCTDKDQKYSMKLCIVNFHGYGIRLSKL
jgi:hypothetical protein